MTNLALNTQILTDKLRLMSPAEGVYLPTEDRKNKHFYLLSLRQKHDQITFLLKKETQTDSKPLRLCLCKHAQVPLFSSVCELGNSYLHKDVRK